MQSVKYIFSILLLSILYLGFNPGCPWSSSSDKSTGSSTPINLIHIPLKPSNLNATVISSNQINIYWIDNSNNEGGFKIERSINTTNFIEIAVVGPDIITYVDTGLAAGTTYYYRVYAFNSNGNSMYSNVTLATTFPTPSAPSNLVATATTYSMINLTWVDNSDNEIGFKIERRIDAMSFTQIANINANTAFYCDTGLTEFTIYYYRVYAYNLNGNSICSNIAYAKTPLVPPTNLNATAISSSQINIYWFDNSDNESGFKVERGTTNTLFTEIITLPVNTTAYSDTGLSAATIYYYRARAYNTTGDSPYSNEASATTSSPFYVTAIDALGHLDDSGNPVYTRGTINDVDDTGLCYPESVAVDSGNYRLFVADSYNNRVLVFNLNGDLTLPDRRADFVIGQPDFRSTNQATTQSGLYYPTGLVYDSTNNRLFVTDYCNNRVMVFDITNITDGEDAINVLGVTNFTSKGMGGQNGMLDPTGLAYDNINNRLFVSSTYQHRVLVFDTSTIINGESPINVLGNPVVYDATTRTLGAPVGLAYDTTDNRLFVADNTNNRVMVFDVTTITNGEDAINVIGQTDFTINYGDVTTNTLWYPTGLTYDSSSNRLFVTDSDNQRIMVFDVTAITNGEDAINVLGQTDFTSYTEGTTQNRFNLSWNTLSGLACGGNRLFMTDYYNSRVMVFDVVSITNGENAVDVLGHLDDAGNPIYIWDGANNPRATTFATPSSIAVDMVNHRLFVADRDNNRVLVFNLNNDLTLPDRVPDFVLGQPDFRNTTANATQNGLSGPRGLAYDQIANRLFVADFYNGRVLIFDVTTVTNGEDAINVLGQPDFVSRFSAITQNRFIYPSGLAYDSINNRLFVASYSRVMVFDITTVTNGEDAINVLGQPDFTSNTYATAQNKLGWPYDLAYNTTNNRLFVADSGNDRILVFDVSTINNGEDAINVLGQPDFTSKIPATSQNGLKGPYGITYDSVNKWLFVSDGGNNRILVFDVTSITNGENSVGVIGQSDFNSNTPATTQSGLYIPWGLVYVGANNRFFVADSRNHRIMVYALNYQ